MEQELSLGWPAAVAIISSVVALTVGMVRLLSNRGSVSIDAIYADQKAMSARVQELEQDVARLNASVDALRAQLSDTRGDIGRLSTRIDAVLERIRA